MEPFTPNTNTTNMQNTNNAPVQPAMPNIPAAGGTGTNNFVKPQQPVASKPSIFKQWYFWTILGVAILGVLGIGFGAYELDAAMMAQDKIAQLERNIQEKDQLLVRYGLELGYRLDDFGRPLDSPDEDKKNTQYLSLEEWELKFRIPENLQNISYTYKLNTVMDEETGEAELTSTFCATGTLYETQNLPAYAVLSETNPGLGCITRTINKEAENNGELAYNYHISGPQATYSDSEQLIKEELETVQAVRKMLTERIAEK